MTNAEAQTPQSFLDLGRTGKSEWWRYLCGSLLIYLGLRTASLICLKSLFFFSGDKARYDQSTGQIIGVDPLASFVAINLIFVCVLLTIWLVVRFLHGRSLFSLITPAKRINLRYLLFS